MDALNYYHIIEISLYHLRSLIWMHSMVHGIKISIIQFNMEELNCIQDMNIL